MASQRSEKAVAGVTSRELDALFRLVEGSQRHMDARPSTFITFSGSDLLSRISETFGDRKQAPSVAECQVVAQHMLDTGVIDEVTSASSGPPCLVFSPDRVYATALFRELSQRHTDAAVSAIRESLASEATAGASDAQGTPKATFSGAAAVEMWTRESMAVFRRKTVSRAECTAIGQELVNKGHIVAAPGGRADFHDTKEDAYTIGTPFRCWGFLLKRRGSNTKEWRCRWVCCRDVSDKRAFLFLTPRHAKPRSFINLDDCTVTAADFAPNSFVVVTKRKLYVLRAPTQRALTEWVGILQLAAVQVMRENSAIAQAESIIFGAESSRATALLKDGSRVVPTFGVLPATRAVPGPSPPFSVFVSAKSVDEDERAPGSVCIAASVTDFTGHSIASVEESTQHTEASGMALRGRIPNGDRATCAVIYNSFVWVGTLSGSVLRFPLIANTSPEDSASPNPGDGQTPLPRRHVSSVVSLIHVAGTVWSGDSSGLVIVWDSTSGESIRGFASSPGRPALLSAGRSSSSSNGFSGGGGGCIVFGAGVESATVNIWDTSSGSLVNSVAIPGSRGVVHGMCSTGDDTRTWIAADSDLFVFDNVTQRASRVRVDYGDDDDGNHELSQITSMAAAGPRRLWTGHKAGEVCIWELERDWKSAQVYIHRKAHSGAVESVAISSSGASWSCSTTSQLLEWRGLLAPWRCLDLPCRSGTSIVCCSSNGDEEVLVVCAADGSVLGYRREQGTLLRSVASPTRATPTLSPIATPKRLSFLSLSLRREPSSSSLGSPS